MAYSDSRSCVCVCACVLLCCVVYCVQQELLMNSLSPPVPTIPGHFMLAAMGVR